MAEETTRSSTALTYDGRNFLVRARQDANSCSPVATQSTYSSEGVLLRRATSNVLTGALSKDTKLLYFAGRPLALVETTTTPATATYLSVDHLGTPILETTAAGASLWTGGFEPFGKDWNGAQAAGEFLRFPGQWEDASWTAASGAGFEYNVNRWYDTQASRYTSPDPLQVAESNRPFMDVSLNERWSLYSYVDANPSRFTDPLGLLKFAGCGAEQQSVLNGGLKDFCSKLDSPEFSKCCASSSVRSGLKKLCADTNLVVRCEASPDGRCKGDCGWSLPFIRVVHFCPDGFKSALCGPAGCTLLHEMTHITGHPFEKWPRRVEKCLGCGG
jgi:RHS repeat-associated protein